jgi:hypothetical protein
MSGDCRDKGTTTLDNTAAAIAATVDKRLGEGGQGIGRVETGLSLLRFIRDPQIFWTWHLACYEVEHHVSSIKHPRNTMEHGFQNRVAIASASINMMISAAFSK